MEKEKDAYIATVVIKILEELESAEKKHPVYPTCLFQQLAIIQEELGETTKSILHFHYENGNVEDIKKELIQTSAMCIRMLIDFERRKKEWETQNT